MLTKKELQIIDLYRSNIFTRYTIRAIMKKLKTKSYDWTNRAVNKLIDEKILNFEEQGKSKICSINLDEQRTIAYLALLEELNPLIKKIPKLKKITEIMPIDFHILMITGSYADGSFTKESDLDIVVILDNKKNKKNLWNKLSNEGELSIPKWHSYVFEKKELLEMLTNKKWNYGKEMFKKHLIISGAELYYKMVREAIDHGFKGR